MGRLVLLFKVGLSEAEGLVEFNLRFWEMRKLFRAYPLVFNSDNKYLVSGGDDVSIRLWDIKHLKVTK